MPDAADSFATPRGQTLYYQLWGGSAGAPLVILHGGGEHSGRYVHTAERLTQEGVAVWAFDLQGHGRSPGKRGHIDRFEDYVADLRDFIRFVSERAGALPVLLGHSLGGLISAYFAIEYPQTIRCLILSSPLWGLNIPVPRWKHIVAVLASTLWPSLILRRPTAGATVLSHDPEVGVRYRNDPLVHFKASARLYTEVTVHLEQLPQVLPHLTIPVLVLQAGDDQIASTQATTRLFPLIGSTQKKLIVYDGYYHEILNEVGKERVIGDLAAWVQALG